MVKIYCIQDCNGLKYIGSTKSSLKHRLGQHKSDKKTTSRELDLQNCKIYTLEETDEENRKVREQYWIDNTECVNKCKVIGNKKEYNKQLYQENKDEILQRQKQYHQKNRDEILQKRREKYHFKNSWGGNPKYGNNNLLKIDLDIFI